MALITAHRLLYRTLLRTPATTQPHDMHPISALTFLAAAIAAVECSIFAEGTSIPTAVKPSSPSYSSTAKPTSKSATSELITNTTTVSWEAGVTTITPENIGQPATETLHIDDDDDDGEGDRKPNKKNCDKIKCSPRYTYTLKLMACDWPCWGMLTFTQERCRPEGEDCDY